MSIVLGLLDTPSYCILLSATFGQYTAYICVYLLVLLYIRLMHGLWIIKFCFPLYMYYLKYGPPAARFHLMKAVILGCDFV